jgi:NitT/TauT family transport system substrate-binding protein
MRLKKILSFLSLILLLSACTSRTSETLRLGTNIWPGYEPLYLARTNHYLDKKQVHLVEFSASSQVIRAYRNNLIDAAALTLDEVLLLLQTEENPKIILVLDISSGGDAIVAQPEITQFSQLAGRRIGVENNALGAYVLQRALIINGMQDSSVKIIQLDVSEQVKAFSSRKIDAVVTFDPVKNILLGKGGHVLFNSKQIPGEIIDVLIVREKFLNQHPESVRHLISGWHKALSYINNHPNKAALILGSRIKSNTTATLADYRGLKFPDLEANRELLYIKYPQLRATANKLTDDMLKYNLLKKRVLTDGLFLNEAQKLSLHLTDQN